MKDIRKAGRKFSEAVTELEQILLPYMEALVDGRAPLPEGLEMRKVNSTKEYAFYTFHHNGDEIACMWKGSDYKTLLITGLTTGVLWECVIPSYEEWVDVITEAVRDE